MVGIVCVLGIYDLHGFVYIMFMCFGEFYVDGSNPKPRPVYGWGTGGQSVGK